MAETDLGAGLVFHDQPCLAAFAYSDAERGRALVKINSLGKRANGKVGKTSRGHVLALFGS